MGLTPQNPKTRNHPKTGFFGQANTRKKHPKTPPFRGVSGFRAGAPGWVLFFNFSKANNHGHLHQNDKHRGNPRWQTQ